MRLSIIRHNSTDLCASNKSLSKIWFYVIYYVDCQLDTILCLDLVFRVFGIQSFGHFGFPAYYSPHCVDNVICVAIHDLHLYSQRCFPLNLRDLTGSYNLALNNSDDPCYTDDLYFISLLKMSQKCATIINYCM